MKNLYSLLIPMPVEVVVEDDVIAFDTFSFVSDESLKEKLTYIEPLFAKEGSALSIKLKKDPLLKEGFYCLKIAREGSSLSFSSDSGMYNGLGSLYQMMVLSEGEINAATVYDGPKFGYRGLLLDCARHFFPVSYIKKLLLAAFINHLNIFHWHLTNDQGWRIEIKSHPELCAVNKDYYTQEQIKEVVSFAKGLGIDVIPEVECPGHVSALLAARPEFGCTGGPYRVEPGYGVFEDVLCVGNDDVYPFLDEIISEVAPLFTSKYFHIGGDECPSVRWQTCPKCKAKMESLGLDIAHDTQWYFTKRITEIVRKYGKIPMGWDEISNSLSRHDVDSDITMLLWRGPDAAAPILANGNPLVICRYDDGSYLDYKMKDDQEEAGWLGVNSLEMSYNMKLDYKELPGHERIIGGQANLWSEQITFPITASYLLFPRMNALAENFWSEKKDFEGFKKRMVNLPRVLESIGIKVALNLED